MIDAILTTAGGDGATLSRPAHSRNRKTMGGVIRAVEIDFTNPLDPTMTLTLTVLVMTRRCWWKCYTAAARKQPTRAFMAGPFVVSTKLTEATR